MEMSSPAAQLDVVYIEVALIVVSYQKKIL